MFVQKRKTKHQVLWENESMSNKFSRGEIVIEVEVGVIDCLTLLIYHKSCHQKKQEGAKTEIGSKK